MKKALWVHTVDRMDKSLNRKITTKKQIKMLLSSNDKCRKKALNM